MTYRAKIPMTTGLVGIVEILKNQHGVIIITTNNTNVKMPSGITHKTTPIGPIDWNNIFTTGLSS